VWAAVTRPETVNYELGPWLRMTVPRGARGLSLASVPIGMPLGRAWVLLFGVLPIDYDDLTLVAIGPGPQFHERSPMLNCRQWTHRRSVVATPKGSVLTDRINFQPRWFMSGRLYQAIAQQIFRHRHRRLRHRFGPV
jgi:ligand-binding SRPBCC domain-containing protein